MILLHHRWLQYLSLFFFSPHHPLHDMLASRSVYAVGFLPHRDVSSALSFSWDSHGMVWYGMVWEWNRIVNLGVG